MRYAPKANPAMLPTMAAFETHALAVARTLVGNNSARNAPNDGVSIVAPRVARKIDAARNHPESSK
jgi:hypothetical protein